MNKPLFNEAGLQTFLQQLYSFNEQQLAVEVSRLEADFMGYIKQCFQLYFAQEAFLDQMHTKALSFLKQQSIYAIANRLPISLLKIGDKKSKAEDEDDDEEGDKLFEPQSNMQATADGKGNFVPGGRLLIVVRYL